MCVGLNFEAFICSYVASVPETRFCFKTPKNDSQKIIIYRT